MEEYCHSLNDMDMEENCHSLIDMDPGTPASEPLYASSDVTSSWGDETYSQLAPPLSGVAVPPLHSVSAPWTDQFERHTLQRAFKQVFPQLTQSIMVADYLDYLVAREVISLGVMDVIRSKGNAQDMARELLVRVCNRDEGCVVMMELFQHRDISQRHLYQTVLEKYNCLRMEDSVPTAKTLCYPKGTTQNPVSHGKYAEFVIEVMQFQTLEGRAERTSNACQLVRCSLTGSRELAVRVLGELQCLVVEDGPIEDEYVHLICLSLTPISSVTAEGDFEWVELSHLMTDMCVADQSDGELHCYIRDINFCHFTSEEHKAKTVNSFSMEKSVVSLDTSTIHKVSTQRKTEMMNYMTSSQRVVTSLSRNFSKDTLSDLNGSHLPETLTLPTNEDCSIGMEGLSDSMHSMKLSRNGLSDQRMTFSPAGKDVVSKQESERSWNTVLGNCRREVQPSSLISRRQSGSPEADSPPFLPVTRRQPGSPEADTPTSLPVTRKSKSSETDCPPSLPVRRRPSGSPEADSPPSVPVTRQQSGSPENATAPKDLLALLRKAKIGVGKEKVKSSKVMNDVTSQILDVLRSAHELVLRPSYAGSSFEGAKIESADEYDVLIMLDGKDLDRTVHHSPYASLHPRNPDNYKLKDYLDVDGFLDPAKITSQIYSWTQLAINKLFPTGHEYQVTISKNGPAVKLSIKCKQKTDFDKIDVDLVPAFEVLNDHYVPKPCKADIETKAVKNRTPRKEVLWRKSFSLLEKERLTGIDKDRGCRRQCLKLLKFLRLRESTLKGLESYHYKILLLNECEQLPQTEMWAAAQLAERFWGLLNQLSLCLKQRKLPHFADENVNLFEEINGKAMENMRTRLNNIIKKGILEMEKILMRDPI